MAKQKKLKCKKCDRRFSMPAHLARHMNAWHGRKARKPKTLDNWRNAFKVEKSQSPQIEIDAPITDLASIVAVANKLYDADNRIALVHENRAFGIKTVLHGIPGFRTTGEPELPL